MSDIPTINHNPIIPRIWPLQPLDDLPDRNAWEPWYDKAFGFVVRASDELAARQFADANGGDETHESRRPWLDANQSTCVELTGTGGQGVVLRNYASA